MNAQDWHPNPPPHGLTREQIEEWAVLYAPRLRFHRNERHFPSDPDAFRIASRFRESRQRGRDLGWDKEGHEWVKSNDRESKYFGAEPGDLTEQTAVRIGQQIAVDPGLRVTLRPNGERNMHRSAGRSRDGLFLERDDSIDRGSSGSEPRSGIVTAPLFLDATRVEFSGAGPFVKVLYWFFYELNYFLGFLTHEGDWEHVSYLVSRDGLLSGDPPSVVYFAQHNGGEPRSFSSLKTAKDQHPVTYVDRHGHPTRADVSDPSDYTAHWDTWTGPPRWLRDEAWKEFSGAWGEVGETKHTTGPLGPWFKQGSDLLRVRRAPDGQILVSIPKS